MKGTKRFSAVITSLLAAGALAVSASAAATTAHNYKGDVIRDDKVDTADVVALYKYITGRGSISANNLVYADMNGDGNVNVIDFIILKSAVLNDEAPEEIVITTPAATTAAATTNTTTATSAVTAATTKAAATTATTKATTAATTKATTAATTKATTAATTKATTTTSTTKATTTTTTTKATTTTTTTKATTTTTTIKATTTTTTTTATTAASEAATSKTYPAKVGNGVNSIAPESVDRAFIILGGDNNTCKYDESTNINDFVPGSVQMPEITGDGNYKASFYVYDEGIIEKTGGTFISSTYLRILKAGTWETYTTDEKHDLKITVTKATTDGVQRDLSEITQESGKASVDISSVLGTVNNVEIEFTVEGFNSTGSSGESSSSGSSTPSSGSTRTVTIASDKTYASSDMNNWSLSDVIGSGETIENIVIRISPVSGNDTIGGINFNLRTPDYVRINQNIQTTVSDAAYTFSLADVLDESGKEKLSTVTGSDEIILQSYWLQNGNIKIDSIEVTLKS